VLRTIAAVVTMMCIMAAPVCSLAGPGAAIDEHTKTMLKQHESMLTLQREWLAARKALDEGRAKDALAPATAMAEAARVQDSFMLHKHPEKMGEFMEKSRRLRVLISDFGKKAKSGDTRALGRLARKIDAACDGCHKTFR
jgi:hypothetical protein